MVMIRNHAETNKTKLRFDTQCATESLKNDKKYREVTEVFFKALRFATSVLLLVALACGIN